MIGIVEEIIVNPHPLNEPISFLHIIVIRQKLEILN